MSFFYARISDFTYLRNLNKLFNTELGEEYASVYQSTSKTTDFENNISISAPIISYNGTTANIKGTILSDVDLASRGVILSLEPNASMKNCIDYHSKNDDVLNETFEVAPGYTYYVRLVAKTLSGKYFYGEEAQFTVPGKKLTQIANTQILWAPKSVKISLDIPPYSIKDYGICWSDKPGPKITDNYLPEKTDDKKINRTDEWEIEGLNRETKYYGRAYHIDGSNVVYYPGEFEFQTLGLEINAGLEIQFDPAYFESNKSGYWMGTLRNADFHVFWKGLPEGEYKAEIYFYNHNQNTNYGSFRQFFHINGGNGEKDFINNDLVFYSSISGMKSAGSYVYLKISDLNDSPIITTFYRCAWSREKFIFNPIPQEKQLLLSDKRT